jgi:N-acetylglutamate synthase-like GNAT family acetyltransferase
LQSKFTRSLWFKHGKVEVYVRAGSEFYDKRSKARVPAIAIANVLVKEKLQRKGHFTRFLAEIETLAKELGYQSVFVEQVGNPHLRNFLLKNGYAQVGEKPEHLSDTVLVKDV